MVDISLDNEELQDDATLTEFLTWKNKLKTILHTTQYCGICLEEKNSLFDLEATVTITEISRKYETTFQDMLSNICSTHSSSIFASNLLCEDCAALAIQLTIFISKVKMSAHIIETCLKNIKDNVDYTFETIHDFENYEKTLICFDLRQIIEACKEDMRLLYKCQICRLEFSDEEIFRSHCGTHKTAGNDVQVIPSKPPEPEPESKLEHVDETECEDCKVWVKNSDLNQHKKLHEQRTWHCSACDKVFYSVSSFTTHLIMKHNIISKDSIFSCTLCYKSYFTKTTLNTHKCKYKCSECEQVPCQHEEYLISYRNQKVAGQNTIQCPKCDFKGSRKSSLISHVNLDHLNSFNHFCSDCNQSFHSKHSLIQHKLKFHQESLICEYCDESFKGKVNFLNHQTVCKDVKHDFKCKQCSEMFDNKDTLYAHLSMHVYFYCTICNSKFISEDKLNIHMGESHRTNISCSMCLEDFDTQEEYLAHVRLHPVNSKHICRHCSMTFNSKFNHRSHVMNAHSATGKITCNVCGKIFSKCNLKYHLESHSKDKSSRKKVKHVKQVCKCDLCDKWFSSIKVLKRHKQKHKEEVQCEVCRKFVRPVNMERHLRTHTHKASGKKLKCDQCDYDTNYPLCMDAHMNRMHFKVRPYKCTTCNKSFYGKITLHEHVKCHTDTTVTGRQCELCGEYFCNSFSLRTHMRLHTGEKPYPCSECEEKFVSASRRKEHVLKRHTVPKVPCPICKNMYYSTRDVRAHIKKIHFNMKKGELDVSQLRLSEKDMYIFKDKRIL